ncbi:MAG: MBL fold metallo-hydrolase [Lachnospiraceae bacterium]|nr:MBL fold metallo-hydrolase [Lachnospiraceae bacterium]
MKLTFIGATHEVTGSCTLLEIGGKHILIDCGMEQGTNIYENIPLPVAEPEIDCVFLTHAHIDHSGNLPLLYKKGFRGQVYATPATCSLCDIMLRDCAHIQENEAEYTNRKSKRAGREEVEPVYDMKDTEGLLKLLRPVEYDRIYRINENVTVRFTDIGHLLGSAAVELWLSENGVEKKLVFSGDVGNTDQPIIKDPQRVREADCLVIESTYGDRLHPQRGEYLEILTAYIQRTLDRGGNVIIPSFAVGRTQEILYFIREIKTRHLVHGHDGFPVYVDSPLAIEATGVFMQCGMECLDEETRALMAQGINPLVFEGLRLNVTTEESIALNTNPEPKVIISASGMCDAGRVRHHLKYNLWRRECLILFVGYQAAGTLGRMIYDGAKKVKLFGDEIAVNAEIGFLPGVSGHADKQGLLDWLDGFEQKPGQIFVNHGDPDACEAFTDCLNQDQGLNAYAPYSGAVYDLAAGEFVRITEGVPCRTKTDGTGQKEAGVQRAAARKPAETRKTAGAQRAASAYDTLLTALQKLNEAAKGCEGMANKDLLRYAERMERLAEEMR